MSSKTAMKWRRETPSSKWTCRNRLPMCCIPLLPGKRRWSGCALVWKMAPNTHWKKLARHLTSPANVFAKSKPRPCESFAGPRTPINLRHFWTMDTNNVGLQLQIGGERALPKPELSFALKPRPIGKRDDSGTSLALTQCPPTRHPAQSILLHPGTCNNAHRIEPGADTVAASGLSSSVRPEV